jgi:hypothetical protein
MNISENITRALSRSALQVQKHSPVLLTGAGIVALVGAGVLAARATLKLEETLDKGEENLNRSKALVEAGEEDQTLITKALVHNGIQVAKLYWQPTTLTLIGIAFVLSGHHILNKRYAGMVLAYKGLETAFSNYRSAVVEKYGQEIDEAFRYGISTEKVEGEDGKKKEVTVVDRARTSEYIFDFGPDNQNWVGNYEHNLFFLTGHQNIFNDMLRARGHVFLSEVLDGLGIPRTPASIVTGWIYDPERNKGGEGDNFIDFGIKDLYETNGYILLDFNVDGTIYDNI